VRVRIDALGLAHVDLHQAARTLTLAERQLVEIARGVARGARVLILDEPTATLSDVEIQRVFEAVRWLRGQGAAVVFISHRLPEVYALTDRVTVFRNGRRVLTEDTRALPSDELVRAMIGRDVERHAGRATATAASQPGQVPRLALQGFAVAPRLQPLDLAVPAGQVLAVVGQLGSGADLLVEALAGLRQAGGRLLLDGMPVDVRTPREAIARGIAYVPEDRAGKGVFLDAPVAANVTASILGRLATGGLLRRGEERRVARELALRFSVDPRRLGSEVAQLSGGNQQKVALAKAAALGPRLLVLNEPTRGVDIGARAEIYKRLRAMAAEGLAVVFFSTDLEEVLELADRVVTVFRGAVVGDHAIEAAGMDGILGDITRGPAAAGRVAA
jgi:ABC-type sugar transport system ATPase subunit